MISQANLAIIRQSTDIFVFAMSNKECEEFEQSRKLPIGSIWFDIPTRKEIKEGILRDLYSFYHIDPMNRITRYLPLPKTSRDKIKEKEFMLQDNDNDARQR
jgi:hypothetical protein